MPKSKFIHTLSESTNIFVLEQKAIVLSFVNIVAFLLGHPVYIYIYIYKGSVNNEWFVEFYA